MISVLWRKQSPIRPYLRRHCDTPRTHTAGCCWKEGDDFHSRH
jgi:hypothetical protein